MALNNRTTRILVSVLAIPVIVALCLWGGFPFLLFTTFIGLTAFYEFADFNMNKENNVNIHLGLLSVFALILNKYFHFIPYEVLFILIVGLVSLTELFRNAGSAINNIGSTLLGILYIGLFSSTLIGLREGGSSHHFLQIERGYLILAILISIWVCDSAAYFLGTAFGKHKLFPRVSPKKSWEGAIAGLVFAVIAMVAIKGFFLNYLSYTDAVVVGIITGTIGQLGDLIESLFKRDANVKDSSSLIPGHGGIFDRFDSLLLSAPFVYLYLVYFAN